MGFAIIGTGNVGRPVARRLKGKGHRVTMDARDPRAAMDAGLATDSGAAPLPPEAAAEAAVRALAPSAGKTAIDCTNRLGMVDGALGLTVGHATSGEETARRWVPLSHVIKTLNQGGAEIIAKNDHLPRRPVRLIAGDEGTTKAASTATLAVPGFPALDARGAFQGSPSGTARHGRDQPGAFPWQGPGLDPGRDFPRLTGDKR